MFTLIFSALCLCNIISVQSIDITTTLGPIRGKLVDGKITGAYYCSFEGIPYAEPPLKDLRFKPPVQKRPWKTVLDATKPGNVCPQQEIVHSRKQMCEDCLFFNIYTPANFLNKLLPVMVYIHTGNFKLLSGNPEPIHGPQFLIQRGIVVVTMNYRLGALGFLSLCTCEASGNAGIKDVLLVLKLVKSNIQRFGGDPNKITLAGNGAGSAIVQYLMLTNQSVGLFQRVLIQSASVLCERFIQYHPRDNAISLGKELGLRWTNDNNLLQKLRKVNAFDIVRAQEAISDRDPQKGVRFYSPFNPTVEVKNPTAIITKQPLDMMKEGAIQNIPMTIGFNNQEGVEIVTNLRSQPCLINGLNKNPELYVPGDIEYPFGSIERRKLSLRIKDFYFKGQDISFVNVQNYFNMVADIQYIHCIDKFVKLYKKRKTASVYYYEFNGDEQLNWFKLFENVTYPGAVHDDDIGYMFLTSATKSIYPYIDATTKKLQDSILDNVKHFMLFGYPAPNAGTACWPEAGKDRYHLVHGCNNIAVFHRPLPKRIDFWESVYDEYYKWSKYNGSCFCTNPHPRITYPLL